MNKPTYAILAVVLASVLALGGLAVSSNADEITADHVTDMVINYDSSEGGLAPLVNDPVKVGETYIAYLPAGLSVQSWISLAEGPSSAISSKSVQYSAENNAFYGVIQDEFYVMANLNDGSVCYFMVELTNSSYTFNNLIEGQTITIYVGGYEEIYTYDSFNKNASVYPEWLYVEGDGCQIRATEDRIGTYDLTLVTSASTPVTKHITLVIKAIPDFDPFGELSGSDGSEDKENVDGSTSVLDDLIEILNKPVQIGDKEIKLSVLLFGLLFVLVCGAILVYIATAGGKKR